MNDISKLLDAQKTDKERLSLLLSLEQSDTKCELDAAKRIANDAKTKLLSLDEEAGNLKQNFARLGRVVEETVKLVENAKKSGGDVGEFNSALSRLSILEGHLADIERKISEKTAAFNLTYQSGARAQSVARSRMEEFEKQKLSLKGKLDELDTKFETQMKGVPPDLAAKYRTVRKQKAGDTKDIVVQVVPDNRCGGCYMEVSLSHINQIASNGWTTCEECGRVIYKDANPK
jgi:predicted  nucleic acid-binding Zn-ribbon protein